jgi:hypothetical protein
MKVTLIIEELLPEAAPIGMIATDLEHLIRILQFQTREKGMKLSGVLNLKPELEAEINE